MAVEQVAEPLGSHILDFLVWGGGTVTIAFIVYLFLFHDKALRDIRGERRGPSL